MTVASLFIPEKYRTPNVAMDLDHDMEVAAMQAVEEAAEEDEPPINLPQLIGATAMQQFEDLAKAIEDKMAAAQAAHDESMATGRKFAAAAREQGRLMVEVLEKRIADTAQLTEDFTHGYARFSGDAETKKDKTAIVATGDAK